MMATRDFLMLTNMSSPLSGLNRNSVIPTMAACYLNMKLTARIPSRHAQGQASTVLDNVSVNDIYGRNTPMMQLPALSQP
jgi:hypothetical protein